MRVLDPKLIEINAFVNAYKSGSILAASRRLNVSAATLGNRIQNLEAALNAVLLVRRPSSVRSVELTEAGRAFYPHALTILDAIERAKASIVGGPSREPFGIGLGPQRSSV